MVQRLTALEELLGHTFKNRELAISAITHASAAEGKGVAASYERLEFLGDAVLGDIVAREVFERFPEMDEGRLTDLKIALVEGKMLAARAAELGLAPLIIFGESELGTAGRGLNRALEDVFEACVGALYLDGGYEVAHAFVLRMLGEYMVPEQIERSANPKTRLQEILQRGRTRVTPTYKLESEDGPAHERVFTSVALAGTMIVGRGSGRSKKDSEGAAAADAIARIEAAHGIVRPIEEPAVSDEAQSEPEGPEDTVPTPSE